MKHPTYLIAILVCMVTVGCKPTAGVDPVTKETQVAKSTAKDEKKVEGSALERALKAKGSFTVLGYSTVGRVQVAPYRGVEVQARELRDGENGKERLYGLLVSVAMREEGTRNAFVDYDELEPLLSAMDKAAKADKSLTRFNFFQVDYTTRGGLKVITFNDEKDVLNAGIQAGYGSSLYMSMSQFREVRDLLAKAKAVVDETRNGAATSGK